MPSTAPGPRRWQDKSNVTSLPRPTATAILSLHLSVPSLSPNGWCRALLIFHYHFLNLVTSPSLRFSLVSCCVKSRRMRVLTLPFHCWRNSSVHSWSQSKSSPDGFKSLFKPFPSFYFLQLQMCSFSPSLLPSLPPPKPASLRGFPLSSLQSQ